MSNRSVFISFRDLTETEPQMQIHNQTPNLTISVHQSPLRPNKNQTGSKPPSSTNKFEIRPHHQEDFAWEFPDERQYLSCNLKCKDGSISVPPITLDFRCTNKPVRIPYKQLQEFIGYFH